MKKVIISTMIISLLSFTGCAPKQDLKNNASISKSEYQEEIEALEKEIESLKQENDRLGVEVAYLQEEKNYYREAIDEGLKYLSNDQKAGIAKQEWSYQIKVNDEVLPSSGQVVLRDIDKVNMILSETQASFPIIRDNEIFIKGKISDDYSKHIEFTNIKPTKVKDTAGTIVTALHYEFSDLKKGDTIKIKITRELQERLGLGTKEIEIIME